MFDIMAATWLALVVVFVVTACWLVFADLWRACKGPRARWPRCVTCGKMADVELDYSGGQLAYRAHLCRPCVLEQGQEDVRLKFRHLA